MRPNQGSGQGLTKEVGGERGRGRGLTREGGEAFEIIFFWHEGSDLPEGVCSGYLLPCNKSPQKLVA